MRRITSLVSFSLVLLLSACSDDGGSTSADVGAEAPAGGGGDTADAATGSATSGGLLDNDFPIPALADPVVLIDSIPGNLTVDYPGDRYDEIVAFYEQWISEQPEEWSLPPDDVSDGVGWFSLALEGEPGYGLAIVIARDIGSDGNVGVSLNAALD